MSTTDEITKSPEGKEVLSESKKKRLESKKKKVEAFLKLAEENDMGGRGRKRKKLIDVTSKSSSKKQKSEEYSEDNIEKETPGDTKKKDNTETVKEDLLKLRLQIRERQKKSMERPKLFCKSEYSAYGRSRTSAAENQSSTLSPLFVIDVQHVIMCAIQGNKASYKPRFCTFMRYKHLQKTLVISVNGVSAEDFKKYRECFPYLGETFDMQCPLISPSQYGLTVQEELFAVSVSESQLRKTVIKHDADLNNRQAMKHLHKIVKKEKTLSVPLEIPVPLKEKRDSGAGKDGKVIRGLEDAFNRVELLLSPYQMILENYPLPAHSGQYEDFVSTKDEYAKVMPTSPILSIDCEMVETKISSHELAWIAVVDEDLKVVYETYVLPAGKIIDYRSRYSGIFKNTLKGVRTRLEDVHDKLREILPPDAILCGQSFQHDLKAMKMFHPYVIDTSMIFNISGTRDRKTGLQKLALEFLGEAIRTDVTKGHNPVEDAIATMRLVKHKLDKGIDYGDIILYNAEETQPPEAKTKDKVKDEDTSTTGVTQGAEPTQHPSSLEERSGEEKEQSDIATKKLFFKRPGTSLTKGFFEITREEKKSVLYVDTDENVLKYEDCVEQSVGTWSDKKRVEAVCENMCNHDITFVQLHKPFRRISADDSTRMEDLTKLDKRIQTMTEAVPDRSLVTVIFSGHPTTTQQSSAMAFIHITMHDT